MKFTLRDLFWLTLVIAVASDWLGHSRSLRTQIHLIEHCRRLTPLLEGVSKPPQFRNSTCGFSRRGRGLAFRNLTASETLSMQQWSEPGGFGRSFSCPFGLFRLINGPRILPELDAKGLAYAPSFLADLP